MHAMNKKDKFFMLLALSCLPLSEMAAEQVDGMAVISYISGAIAEFG